VIEFEDGHVYRAESKDMAHESAQDNYSATRNLQAACLCLSTGVERRVGPTVVGNDSSSCSR
jgi:hypothetical protein